MIKIDRTIENVHSLQWDNQEHSSFSCVVKFTEFNEELPFTASPDDIYEHTLTIWNKGIRGDYGPIKEAEKPESSAVIEINEG